MRVVLDDVHLTAMGNEGGYFYKVFVNLPDPSGLAMPEKTYLLGMVGAFEIEAQRMKMQMQAHGMQGSSATQMSMPTASNRPVQLIFPLTAALQKIWPQNLDKLSISFVRLDGGRRPRKGAVIKVKELRVEAAQ
jgi:tyrosinase